MSELITTECKQETITLTAYEVQSQKVRLHWLEIVEMVMNFFRKGLIIIQCVFIAIPIARKKAK